LVEVDKMGIYAAIGVTSLLGLPAIVLLVTLAHRKLGLISDPGGLAGLAS
jgi:hypothetical protein